MEGDASVPGGWGASVAAGKEAFKFVADFGGHYRDGFAVHTIQGGVEFSGKAGKVVPFFRALAGLVVFSGGGDSASAFVVTPEAGVKIMANDMVGAQVSAGFPFMMDGDGHAEGFRLFAGIVIRR